MKIKFLIFGIVCIFVCSTAFLFTKTVSAQSPFGGQIYYTQPCQCPVPGYLIWVGPPVPAAVLYTFGSILYPNFDLFTLGTWSLGLYTKTPVACGVYTANGCFINNYGNGIIQMVGTS